MCGIVGYVGAQQATPILLDGLRRLEYRGYDSAGIAVLGGGGKVEVRKRAGKVAILDQDIQDHPLPFSSLGIGHTRWATHGSVTDGNAHPHLDCLCEIAVIHNGIIENYRELREELRSQGHEFRSETDTEVLTHLIESYYAQPERDLLAAVRLALKRVQGAYSIVVMSQREPDMLVGARGAGPLIVGVGKDEQFLASDIPALLKHTRQVIILQAGELVALRRGRSPELCDVEGKCIQREPITIEWDVEAAEKGGYDTFMLKEIHEQPEAIARALLGRIRETPSGPELHLPELDAAKVARGQNPGEPPALLYEPMQEVLKHIQRVVVVACGTSLHAGLIAKYMLEQWAQVPVEVVWASEFRYSNPVLGPEVLCLAITQSGETADTLAAVHKARGLGTPVISLTNSVDSEITRFSDAVLYLQAGPEICVVSTKTFVSSVTVLALFSLYLGKLRKKLLADELRQALQGLQAIPGQVEQILEWAEDKIAYPIEAVAQTLSQCQSFMFIGRGVGFPIALEGALKLKEVSYIHAEGYPAGELKHGPIALLKPYDPKPKYDSEDERKSRHLSGLGDYKVQPVPDSHNGNKPRSGRLVIQDHEYAFTDTPVFAIVNSSKAGEKSKTYYDKVVSNIEQVRARKAPLVAIATRGDEALVEHVDQVFFVPLTHELLAPLLQVIPLQLFAYHAAIERRVINQQDGDGGSGGIDKPRTLEKSDVDIDKPRNLAKSVTVE